MADNISSKLQSVRTMEDIVNLLSILFTNLNNQNEMYYNMFLNPVPMDLELERYDETGKLVTVTLPNVAKMRVGAYSGEGDPNGKQAASMGSLYIDTLNRSIYYKGSGSDSYGWQLVWSTANLIENVNFISPTGNGSQLQQLNANNIKLGLAARGQNRQQWRLESVVHVHIWLRGPAAGACIMVGASCKHICSVRSLG